MAAAEEDVWARATKVADDLYEIRDTFFPQNPDDKTSKLQHESDLALNLLDSIPAGIFPNHTVPFFSSCLQPNGLGSTFYLCYQICCFINL